MTTHERLVRSLKAWRKVAAGLARRIAWHNRHGHPSKLLLKAYRHALHMIASRLRSLGRHPVQRRTIVMYDDTNLTLIPARAVAVASYVDGDFANASAAKARFPRARHLTITVRGNRADAGDIETRDMSPHSGAAWAKREIDSGEIPVVYANRSTMPAVIRELRKLGIRRDEVKLWVADYTFRSHFPILRWGAKLTKADACQWTDRALGRSLDQSVCAPDFFDR